ncbi:hypothetical protein BDN70DRAFT_76461 [Pholiota conissans]|uniref:Uncharacterized protein n=1 Tax=Pholiota conissans TaxID=109636 RepID=A0A9P6CZ38_9AGAR|nr:hypothetical protein BDN70DRAFT_76461 [Pholiota conissans]
MFLDDSHRSTIDDSYFQLYQQSGARPLPSAQDVQYAACGVGSRYTGEGGGIKHGGSHPRTRTRKQGAGGRLVGKIESAMGSMVRLKATKLRQEDSEASSITLQDRDSECSEAIVRPESAVVYAPDPSN